MQDRAKWACGESGPEEGAGPGQLGCSGVEGREEVPLKVGI